jgi:hypothetical protein
MFLYLDCNFIVNWNESVCIHWTPSCISCRLDLFLADGNYQLIPEPEGGYSEDPKDFVREFSEGPNQSSDVINLTNPSLTSKGKPRTYPTILFTLQSISIHIISCIKSRNWSETLDAWILGTQCNAPESLTDRCSANRAGKSRVISCHSRDLGVVMFTFLLPL